jgi:hypothetical protein
MNSNAFNAFEPGLSQVEILDDPSPINPDHSELEKREKMRDGWRKARAKKKAGDSLADLDWLDFE